VLFTYVGGVVVVVVALLPPQKQLAFPFFTPETPASLAVSSPLHFLFVFFSRFCFFVLVFVLELSNLRCVVYRRCFVCMIVVGSASEHSVNLPGY